MTEEQVFAEELLCGELEEAEKRLDELLVEELEREEYLREEKS